MSLVAPEMLPPFDRLVVPLRHRKLRPGPEAPTENVAERLAKRFGASVGAGAVRELETPVLRR